MAASSESPDWRRFRRECRSLLRQLPPGLRHDISKIRRDDMRMQFAEDILHDALRVARSRHQTTRIPGLLYDSREVVIPVHLRTIMRELDEDCSYRGKIRQEVKQTLRGMHLTKVEPAREPMNIPSNVFAAGPPERGPWEVQADVGLGTASFLEAEPEGWDVWVVRRVLGRYEGCNSAIRICVLGAGPGGIARAVAAVAPEDRRISVHEVDWLVSDKTNLQGVSGRKNPEKGGFQSVVMALPAPALGAAANHRGIYADEGVCGHRPQDVGWLGPRRWLKASKYMLGWFAELLQPAAIGYALLPLGVRAGRTYEQRVDLAHELLEHAGGVGLRIVRTIEAVEVGSVNQPFVGTNRCPRLTVIVQRVVADDDGELGL